ncbi:hypothetical protein D3C72_1982930 [compost metagenome]
MLLSQARLTVLLRLPWLGEPWSSHQGDSASAARRGSAASIMRVEIRVSNRASPSSSCMAERDRAYRNWLNRVAFTESSG